MKMAQIHMLKQCPGSVKNGLLFRATTMSVPQKTNPNLDDTEHFVRIITGENLRQYFFNVSLLLLLVLKFTFIWWYFLMLFM